MALDDAGVGVLADGRCFECQGMTPVSAVVADGNGEGCAYTLFGAGQCGEVVVDKYVASVLQGDGIGARLVVGDIQKRNVTPRVAIV